MVPYYAFMIIAQWFILSISIAGSEHEGMHTKIVILAAITLILWLYQLIQEIIQFRNSELSYWDYFKRL